MTEPRAQAHAHAVRVGASLRRPVPPGGAEAAVPPAPAPQERQPPTTLRGAIARAVVRLLLVIAIATGVAVLLDQLADRPAAFGFYVVGAFVLLAGFMLSAGNVNTPYYYSSGEREQRVRLSFSYVLAGFVILAVGVAVDALTHRHARPARASARPARMSRRALRRARAPSWPAKAAHQSRRRPASTAQLLCAARDRLDVPGAPEHQVHRVEGRVTNARRRVDGDVAALRPAVEDVHGREVAVQEHFRCRTRGEPHRQPPPTLVEPSGIKRGEVGPPLVVLHAGVEEVGDPIGDGSIDRIGCAAFVERPHQRARLSRPRWARRLDERVPGSIASISSAPARSSTAMTAGTCAVCQRASAPPRARCARGRGLALSTAGRPSARQRTTTDMLPRRISAPHSTPSAPRARPAPPGSESSHGLIALPNRRRSRRRSSPSIAGTGGFGIAGRVWRRS